MFLAQLGGCWLGGSQLEGCRPRYLTKVSLVILILRYFLALYEKISCNWPSRSTLPAKDFFFPPRIFTPPGNFWVSFQKMSLSEAASILYYFAHQQNATLALLRKENAKIQTVTDHHHGLLLSRGGCCVVKDAQINHQARCTGSQIIVVAQSHCWPYHITILQFQQ